MGGKHYTRITRDFRRVVKIDGRLTVVTIGVSGLTLRRLRDRRGAAVPVRWSDLAREGGLLDEAELVDRPLLAAAMRRSAGRQPREAAGK